MSSQQSRPGDLMRSPLPLFARLVCFTLAVVTAAQAQSLPHAILTGGVNLSANFDATAFAGAPVCTTALTGRSNPVAEFRRRRFRGRPCLHCGSRGLPEFPADLLEIQAARVSGSAD